MSRRADIAFSAVMLAGSLWLMWQAYRIDGFGGWDSAGTIPMLATAAMSVMAAVLLLRSLAGGAAEEAGSSRGSGGGPARLLPLNLLGVSALFIIYVAALSRFGFYLSTLVFVTLAIMFLERGRPVFALAVALAAIAGIYGAFETFFRVRLP